MIQTTYWITLVHESFKRFLEYMEKYKNTVPLMPSDGIHHLGIKYTVHTCIQYKWFFLISKYLYQLYTKNKFGVVENLWSLMVKINVELGQGTDNNWTSFTIYTIMLCINGIPNPMVHIIFAKEARLAYLPLSTWQQKLDGLENPKRSTLTM